MDVIIMFVSGIVGYILKDLGFNTGAFVLGLILGPIAERGFVQGLLMGNMVSMSNPWIIFFTRPLSLALIALSIFSGAWPFARAAYRRMKGGPTILAAALNASPKNSDLKKSNTDYIGGAIVLAIAAVFLIQIGDWSKYASMAPKSVLIVLVLDRKSTR